VGLPEKRHLDVNGASINRIKLAQSARLSAGCKQPFTTVVTVS
jgi:hypothetical protein